VSVGCDAGGVFHVAALQESQWERPSEPCEEEQVRASHILVKHKGSRRPSSWKTVRPFCRSTAVWPMLSQATVLRECTTTGEDHDHPGGGDATAARCVCASVSVSVSVSVCVRACVRACVRVCVCVRACVCS
jgi:hypothetical protein